MRPSTALLSPSYFNEDVAGGTGHETEVLLFLALPAPPVGAGAAGGAVSPGPGARPRAVAAAGHPSTNTGTQHVTTSVEKPGTKLTVPGPPARRRLARGPQTSSAVSPAWWNLG